MRKGRYTPITTIADGIEFRSRLEASWYLFFQKLGFTPEYEPETFALEAATINRDGTPWYLSPYLPDFYLPEVDCFVEIKPNRATYPLRDQESIHACYVLGYERTSLIILGTPTNYYAFFCNERHKGRPAGYLAALAPRQVLRLTPIVGDCYPDENPIECGFYDFRNDIDGASELIRMKCVRQYHGLAADSWNETKWMAK